MRWLFLLLLIGLVYWLFTQGYVSVDSSVAYIKASISEVITMITDLFGGGGA